MRLSILKALKVGRSLAQTVPWRQCKSECRLQKCTFSLDEPHIYTLREHAAPEQHEPEELPFLEPTLDEAPGGQPLGFKFLTDYQSPSISFC